MSNRFKKIKAKKVKVFKPMYQEEATYTKKNVYALNLKLEALGSDLKNDAEAWAEAEKVQNQGLPTGIQEITTMPQTSTSGLSYNLSGQRVNTSYKGIVIKNGKKTFNK